MVAYSLVNLLAAKAFDDMAFMLSLPAIRNEKPKHRLMLHFDHSFAVEFKGHEFRFSFSLCLM